MRNIEKVRKIIIQKGLCASASSKSLNWFSLPLSCKHIDTHTQHIHNCVFISIYFWAQRFDFPVILWSCVFRGSGVSLSGGIQKFTKTSPNKAAQVWENCLSTNKITEAPWVQAHRIQGLNRGNTARGCFQISNCISMVLSEDKRCISRDICRIQCSSKCARSISGDIFAQCTHTRCYSIQLYIPLEWHTVYGVKSVSPRPIHKL